jgi:ketosteroid isomerase-like protein
MSVENVEVVRQLWKHWERGDWRAGRDLMGDECEFVFSASWFPDAGAYNAGPEALYAWAAFTEAFDELAAGVDQIIEAGEERVVALAWLRGRGRASGVGVDASTGVIFTLRDGKIIRCVFTHRAKALEAAGLSE